MAEASSRKGGFKKADFPGSEGLRRLGILAAWIGGIILIGALLWLLTQPLQRRTLGRTANRVLARGTESLRLGDPLSAGGFRNRRATQMGTWFSLAEGPGRGVVFPIFSGGIMNSFLGLLSADGELERILPLSTGAEQLLETLDAETLEFYRRRLEGVDSLFRTGRRKP